MMSSPHGKTQSKTAPKITFLQHMHGECVPWGCFLFFVSVTCVSTARWANQPCTANMLFIFTPAALSVRRWWLMLCCWVWTWVSLKITQDSHVSCQPSWQKNKGRGRSKTRGASSERRNMKNAIIAWERGQKKKKSEGSINETLSNHLRLHNLNILIFLIRYQIKIRSIISMFLKHLLL